MAILPGGGLNVQLPIRVSWHRARKQYFTQAVEVAGAQDLSLIGPNFRLLYYSRFLIHFFCNYRFT